ncbi:MAG: hypothetical protein ACRC92_20660 [Peptostreptococcaceae bacterium]
MVEMKLGGTTVYINADSLVVVKVLNKTYELWDMLRNKYILTQTQWNYFLGASGKSFCKFNEKEFIELGGTKEEIDNGGCFFPCEDVPFNFSITPSGDLVVEETQHNHTGSTMTLENGNLVMETPDGHTPPNITINQGSGNAEYEK